VLLIHEYEVKYGNFALLFQERSYFFEVISVDYKEKNFCSGVDEKGEILKHPEFLKKAFKLDKKIAFIKLEK